MSHPSNFSSNKSNLVAPLLLVWLALLFRFIYIYTAPHGLQLMDVDASRYHWLGVNLLTHGVFSTASEPPLHPDHVWSPLYPLFLATIYYFTGPVPQVIAFIQAVLDSVTVAVIFQLGYQIGGRQVGLITALFYAMSPALWRFCNELLTEILFGFLLTVSLWMLGRYLFSNRHRDILLFSIFIGLAILCKPNALFVPILLLIVMAYKLFTRQRSWWQGPVIAAIVTILILLPWIIRNHLAFGRWFYTTTFEYNISYVSAVATLAHARGETVKPWTPRWWEIYSEVYHRRQAYSHSTLCDPTQSLCEGGLHLQHLTSAAIEIIQMYPTDFVISHLKGWLRSFVPQEHRFWYERLSGQSWTTLPIESNVLGNALDIAGQQHLGTAIKFIVQQRLLVLPPLALILGIGWAVSYILAAILFCIGVMTIRPRILSLIFSVTIFYITFIPGPISYIRFRLPVVPIILLLIVIGVFSLLKFLIPFMGRNQGNGSTSNHTMIIS